MKPRRTPDSTIVYRLPGGNEDNDLWVQQARMDGSPVVISVWELGPDERAAVAAGANIELTIWGSGIPPLAMHTTTTRLGKG